MESVRNALRVMILLGERTPMRLSDIADELGIARSTVHRILVTLRERGFVVQPIGTRLYTLGPTFSGLASPVLAHDNLIAAARPTLLALRRATEETANLVTRLGADLYYLDGVESQRAVRVGLRNGSRLPVVASAAGLAMLAELSPNRVERVIFLSKRLRDVDEGYVAEQIATVRANGYAVSYGMTLKDVHEVAVAFRYDPGNHIAALTVASPSQRMDKARAQELAPLLRQSAKSLAELLSRGSS